MKNVEMTIENERDTGIELIGKRPWGTHLCHFYQSRDDLIEILVPYFKAGLENNEKCMWITAEPLTAKAAKTALKKVVKNLDKYINSGQLEIIDYSDWYTKSGKFDADSVLAGWVKKETQAVENGFTGLRLTGNTFWLEKKEWNKFRDYEETVNNIISNQKMLAICSYSLDKINVSEVLDVIANHQFALILREGHWECIKNSEFKHVMESLRESEERFRKFFENEPEYCYMISPEGTILDINQAALNALKYKKEELLGKPLKLIYSPESLPKMNKIFETWKRFGKLKNEEIVIVSKEGERRTVLLSADAVKDKNGTILHSISVQRDITERKRSEEDLKKRTHELGERVKELNCLYGLAYLIQQPEIQLDEVFKRTVNIIPRSWQYPENTCVKIAVNNTEYKTNNFKKTKWVQKADIRIHNKVIGSIEVYYTKKKPKEFDGPFLKEEKSLIDEIGNRLSEFITRKQTEDELKKHREKLEELIEERTKELHEAQRELLVKERLATLGELSGSISHELRNPLGVIDSSVYFLKMKLRGSDEKVLQHLNRIKSNVDNASGIIQSLLNLTQMKKPSLLMNDLVSITSESVKKSEIPTNVHLIENFPDDKILVNIDRKQFQMAVGNIIKNAIQAIDGDGTLTVGIRDTKDGRAALSVSDSGPGIPKDDLDMIFQPLFSTKVEGIGFGLSIAKMIMDNHNGTINVKTEPGGGTTFEMYLPQAEKK